MKIKSKKINNELKVVCAETPYLNKASFTILVKAGSVYENKENNGVFHLIEHCIFNGSKKYPTRDDIDKKINELNIIERVTTNKEFTKYNFSFHSKDTLKVLDFLLEILINPVFDKNDIEEERKIILEEMEVDKNNNYRLFYTKANNILFKNTPLVLDSIGTKNSLNRIKQKSVTDTHKMYYNPKNIIVSYAGSLKIDKIFSKLEKYFLRNQKNKSIKYPQFKLNKDGSKKHLIKIAKNFNFMSFSFPLGYSKKGDEDLACLLKFILDEKIKKILISEEKISYDAQVNLVEFEKLGVLDVNSSFSDNNKEKMIEVLKKEFSNLVITKKELNNAKNKIFNIIDFTLDDPTDLSEYLAYNFSDGSLRTHTQEKSDLKKITLVKINNFAKKVLTKNNSFMFFSR